MRRLVVAISIPVVIGAFHVFALSAAADGISTPSVLPPAPAAPIAAPIAAPATATGSPIGSVSAPAVSAPQPQSSGANAGQLAPPPPSQAQPPAASWAPLPQPALPATPRVEATDPTTAQVQQGGADLREELEGTSGGALRAVAAEMPMPVLSDLGLVLGAGEPSLPQLPLGGGTSPGPISDDAVVDTASQVAVQVVVEIHLHVAQQALAAREHQASSQTVNGDRQSTERAWFDRLTTSGGASATREGAVAPVDSLGQGEDAAPSPEVDEALPWSRAAESASVASLGSSSLFALPAIIASATQRTFERQRRAPDGPSSGFPPVGLGLDSSYLASAGSTGSTSTAAFVALLAALLLGRLFAMREPTWEIPKSLARSIPSPPG